MAVQGVSIDVKVFERLVICKDKHDLKSHSATIEFLLDSIGE